MPGAMRLAVTLDICELGIMVDKLWHPTTTWQIFVSFLGQSLYPSWVFNDVLTPITLKVNYLPDL